MTKVILMAAANKPSVVSLVHLILLPTIIILNHSRFLQLLGVLIILYVIDSLRPRRHVCWRISCPILIGNKRRSACSCVSWDHSGGL